MPAESISTLAEKNDGAGRNRYGPSIHRKTRVTHRKAGVNHRKHARHQARVIRHRRWRGSADTTDSRYAQSRSNSGSWRRRLWSVRDVTPR